MRRALLVLLWLGLSAFAIGVAWAGVSVVDRDPIAIGTTENSTLTATSVPASAPDDSTTPPGSDAVRSPAPDSGAVSEPTSPPATEPSREEAEETPSIGGTSAGVLAGGDEAPVLTPSASAVVEEPTPAPSAVPETPDPQASEPTVVPQPTATVARPATAIPTLPAEATSVPEPTATPVPPPPPTATPVPPPPPTATPVPTPPPTATPAVETRTVVSVGGSASFEASGGVVTLLWASPNAGFSVSVDDGGDEIKVEFDSPGHESEIKAKAEDHGLVVEVEEEPKSGGEEDEEDD